MRGDRPTNKTQNSRLMALGCLTMAKGQRVPMEVFKDLMGTTDKARASRDLIKPLQAAGHNIISLACGGYMLLDRTPAENRIIDDLAEIKVMMAGMADIQAAPVVPVPAPVPETVPSYDLGKKSSTPKACVLGDHLLLIAAIAEAHKLGKSFTKTGRPGSKGIHARRIELPTPYNSIGRDRLERIVTELLNLEGIGQDEAGFLIVPGS